MSKKLPAKSSNADIEAFVKQVRRQPNTTGGNRGRLLFAMDATASRAPTWDTACQIQADMFSSSAVTGKLDVQLAYFRGYGEFYASPWHSNANSLLQNMTAVTCLGGMTQIEKVMRHGMNEHKKHKIDAIVFVGDCMEENIDVLCNLAGQLGVLSVPMFVFHESGEPNAAEAFKQIAKLSSGAYSPFDHSSAEQLRELLTAVAIYAVGGKNALEHLSQKRGGMTRLLTQQLKK